jgi:hypothetical protein
MSKSDSLESDFLKLLFQNVAVALVGDANGLQPSATAGSLYVGLHTSDPGEAGTQTTNEANYTGYARVAVARSSGGWTVSGTAPTQVVNAAQINFPQCTSGSSTVTHFSVGTASSGTGKLLYSGALAASLAITPAITPEIAAGAAVCTED